MLVGAAAVVQDEQPGRVTGRRALAEASGRSWRGTLPVGERRPWPAARRLGIMVGVSLFWRVFAINAAVLVAAAVALAVSPATVSARIHLSEVVVLALGVAIVLGSTSC